MFGGEKKKEEEEAFWRFWMVTFKERVGEQWHVVREIEKWKFLEITRSNEELIPKGRRKAPLPQRGGESEDAPCILAKKEANEGSSEVADG